MGRVALLVALLAISSAVESAGDGLTVSPVPFVKQCTVQPGTVSVECLAVPATTGDLARAEASLRAGLTAAGVRVAATGVPVRLELGPVEFPRIASQYRDEIEQQGYRLRVTPTEIVITARAGQGVFYGVQTLLQLIGDGGALPQVDVLDWPDLAVRMVMVDSARQNENADYYRRMIEFLARYKVNVLHWHLTDDEILALYQEDYPALMHPHAWRVEPIRALVDFARERYIEVVPEVESLGHARVFTRHPDFREILHQTTFDKPSQSWAGTEMRGFTNVLCPASDKTYEFLARMYARAAEAFPHPVLHVGCDEVEETTCARCRNAFPGMTFADWIARHLRRCLDLTAQNDRKMAMWGDMLLHQRAVVDQLPKDRVVIYDWHYRREVDPESAAFFKARGFEVIGCPALVCHPRMILPDDENFANIRAFAQVARELDLHGLDTTIWTPPRYMSDVLWPGIAFAAAQAWSGGNYDEEAFYVGFVRDFFGSADGASFARTWRDVCGMRWWLNEFYPACWIDAESLDEARDLAGRRAGEVEALLTRLTAAEEELTRLRANVRRNLLVWDVITQSVATRAYTMKHLLASRDVQTDGRWNTDVVRDLDAGCVQALAWIEANFDRNRHADDANKDGGYLAQQNLLYRFRQMHAFHQKILDESGTARP